MSTFKTLAYLVFECQYPALRYMAFPMCLWPWHACPHTIFQCTEMELDLTANCSLKCYLQVDLSMVHMRESS